MLFELSTTGASNIQYHGGSNPGELENRNGYVWILSLEGAPGSPFQEPGRDETTP